MDNLEGLKKQKEGREELIDIILFSLGVVLSLFLTFRKIENFGENFNELLQPYYAWPLMLLYCADIGYLCYRRYKFAGVSPVHKILMPLFITYFALRLIGYFIFPWGEQIFTLEYSGVSYDVFYKGFSVYDRIVEYLQEMLAISMVYIMFVYYPSFKKFKKEYLYFCMGVTVFIGLLSLIVSLIKDYQLYIYNFEKMIGMNVTNPVDPNEVGLSHEIKGFFINRNVLGFFFSFTILSFMAFNLIKPNVIWTIGSFVFLFFHILCFSRSTLVLSTVGVLGIIAITPIFHWNDKRKTGIFDLVCLGIIILALILLPTAFSGTKIGRGFADAISSLFDFRTVSTRSDLTAAAMNLATYDIRLLLFGWGKIPFHNVFEAFQIAHDGEVLVTAHNAWASSLVTTGIIGLLFVICLDCVVVYLIFRNIKGRRIDAFLSFGAEGAALVIFGILDPQMMFFADAFCNSMVVYYLSFLFPLFYFNMLADDNIKAKEMEPQTLVWPSQM